ncbi:hypothetical protein XBJ2_1240020 [Xenorhabdus bovienii str. Jollieti]|uniref:Uncharacterized protein n=1 Tax=Xenorhabdus bovienii (strain SS-2004) TaxID=406818 RepID=D3V219_XENBS|nr:hypothetical protein XBJ1_2243 [Xenorhabdus bovienii SS-2004]CDH27156.1 hypothetical protein XBJ2_1240020 [Xenorhabdus bovienii str. Jollieti]
MDSLINESNINEDVTPILIGVTIPNICPQFSPNYSLISPIGYLLTDNSKHHSLSHS